MPSKKLKKQYGPDGRYYRKRIKGSDGKPVDVYGSTITELNENVTARRNELAAEADTPPQELFVFEYCAAFFRRVAPHLSDDRQKLYQYQINKVICPVIGTKPMKEITLDDLKDVLATRLVLSKMDLKRVQYLAGHSNPEITLKIYTSLQKANPEELAPDIWAAFDSSDDDED